MEIVLGVVAFGVAVIALAVSMGNVKSNREVNARVNKVAAEVVALKEAK